MKKTITLFIVLMAFGNAKAQVNYYDVAPDIVLDAFGQSGSIDINNNGGDDVLVSLISTTSKFATLTKLTGSSLVATKMSSGATVDQLVLNEGINSIGSYVQGSTGSCTACVVWGAQWTSSVNDAYIGFRTTFTGESVGTFHYGWMRVDVQVVSGAINKITIKDIAWEQTAGVGILAGSAVLSSNDFDVENKFKIFPNPTQNKVTVQLNNVGNASLEVFDVNGKVLLSQNLINASNTININELPLGLYFFKISSDEGVTTQKVVKQ